MGRHSSIALRIGAIGPRSTRAIGRSGRTTKATRRRSVWNFTLALGRRLIRRVNQQVDECGPGWQCGLELLRRAAGFGPLSAKARIQPRQLRLELIRAPSQVGDLRSPGLGLLGIGRGQSQGRQLLDRLLVVGEAPGGLGPRIGLEPPPLDAEPPLLLEDSALGGKHMAVGVPGRELGHRREREVGIEFPAQVVCHGQLLALGLGGGGQVEVALGDLEGLLQERGRRGVVPLCPVEEPQVAQAGGVVGVALAQRLPVIARACS